MRLTRRGYGVLAVAVAAVALSAHSGPRALNAVAGPALVVLVFGVATLARLDAPTVTRAKPAPGFPGETRPVVVHVDADAPVDVTDAVPDGLRPTDPGTPSTADDEVTRRVDASGGASDLTYEVELLARGDRHLGPPTIVQRDPLGVVTRETLVGRTTTVLVYPTVEPIAPNRTFQGLVERTGTPDRKAFDTLREYVPGDALRDVHWKSSAKRQPGDLIVTQFAREDEGGVTVVAEGDSGHGDEMASAAASIVVHLLDLDVEVELYAPGGHVPERTGERHRDDALELLAKTPAGRVAGSIDADVDILADDAGVHVTLNDATFPFAELRAGTVQPEETGGNGRTSSADGSDREVVA